MPWKKIYNKKRNTFLLTLVIIFSLIIRLVFFSGIDTSDGLHNTKYSYDISKNIFPTNKNQGNFRLGLLVPVSVLYSKFGVNDISSTILVLFVSMGGIILIYFFGKFLFNEKVGLLAAFLLSFFPLDVVNSTKFLSDLPSAFFAALSIFIFLSAEKTDSKSKSYLFYALSGMSLGASYSIREMAVLTILFFVVYVIYERKFKKSYLLVAAGFLLILPLEMMFFYAHTENPLYRFSSMDTYYQEAKIYLNFYGRLSLINYLFAWPYIIFSNIQLGYFYAFISLAIFYFIFNRKRETDYLIIWFLSIMLYLNFGSFSITKFAPFLPAARNLSYITMPGILLLSSFLIENKGEVKKPILPFAIIFLLFTSIGAVYLDKSRHGLDLLRELYQIIKSTNEPIYIDARSKHVIEYLSGYNNKLDLQELELNIDNIKKFNNSYIIINYQMIKYRKAAGDDSANFIDGIKAFPSTWEKIKEIGNIPDEKIVIYYVR